MCGGYSIMAIGLLLLGFRLRDAVMTASLSLLIQYRHTIQIKTIKNKLEHH